MYRLNRINYELLKGINIDFERPFPEYTAAYSLLTCNALKLGNYAIITQLAVRKMTKYLK